jgi:hypothetical protein
MIAPPSSRAPLGKGIVDAFLFQHVTHPLESLVVGNGDGAGVADALQLARRIFGVRPFVGRRPCEATIKRGIPFTTIPQDLGSVPPMEK